MASKNLLDGSLIGGYHTLLTNDGQSDIELNSIYADAKIYGRILTDPRDLEYSRGHVTHIKKVIFNDPATVVIWSDGTKTVVKCQPGDVYSKELGLAMCISKKYLGNKGNFNEVFKKWIPEDEEPINDDYLKNIGEMVYNLGERLGNILENTPTIPEMREIIKRYCHDRECRNCVINHLPNHKSSHCYAYATDAEVIENYNAIKNEIKEDA